MPLSATNTVLPPSLENEIIISFDDRDVSKGGFTIGKHMKGATYPVSLDLGGHPQATNVLASSAPTWRGNLWNGIRAPASGYAVKTGTGMSGSTLTVVLSTDTGGGVANGITPADTFDLLGFLGFPLEGGLIIYTDNAGSPTSNVFRYTTRTTNAPFTDATCDYNDDPTVTMVSTASLVVGMPVTGTGIPSGATIASITDSTHFELSAATTGGSVTNGTLTFIGDHKFYGITGGTPATISGGGTTDYGTISPMLNWTTIVTDELIAAAVEYAMGVDPNNPKAFDCSKMYAPDGRTYEEWMGYRFIL